MAKQTARTLRRTSTPAEICLWELVRNRRFYNLKFLRQHPLCFQYEGRKRFFIADFYCAEKKLVVEIDGSIHLLQEDYDSLRSLIINQLGIRVLRLTNEDLLYKLEVVRLVLKENLGII